MLIMPGKNFVLFHYMFVENPVSSASFQQTGLMPRQLLAASLSLFILNGKICDYQGEPEREILHQTCLFIFLSSYAMVRTAMCSQTLLFLLGISIN